MLRAVRAVNHDLCGLYRVLPAGTPPHRQAPVAPLQAGACHRRAYRIKHPRLEEGSEKWMLHVSH